MTETDSKESDSNDIERNPFECIAYGLIHQDPECQKFVTEELLPPPPNQWKLAGSASLAIMIGLVFAWCLVLELVMGHGIGAGMLNDVILSALGVWLVYVSLNHGLKFFKPFKVTCKNEEN